MQRLQAYQYEILPNGAQQRCMRRFAGSWRFVFNRALALQKERYERGEKKLGYAGLCQLRTQWRNGTETPWLADAPTHPLQQALKDLERAYQNFFARRAHFPRFKRKGHEVRLRRYQRAMSRKVKFSQNWQKAKRRVQAIHARIGNARRDFLHKATTTISQNHAMGCIEDLQVGNMSKSSKGSAEAPGKNVRAKSGLNKAILDQGWFEFRRQLEYKLNWAGGRLVAVPPHHTSLTCPRCDYVAAQNRTSQAKFKCVQCGYENHADVVGAMNVLARGYRVIACGEEGAGSGQKTGTKPSSVKQEPTEATMREVDHA
jgi:IS605 OrfB family transposase